MSGLTGTHERCAIVASIAILLSLVLGAAHIWRSVSDPAGELFNKHEWSIVQTLQKQSEGTAFANTVTTISNVFDKTDYDAIALPRLDKQGSVWILSNALGVPRVKLVSHVAVRHICEKEYDQIESAVRLNSDVEALLRALTRPDCSN